MPTPWRRDTAGRRHAAPVRSRTPALRSGRAQGRGSNRSEGPLIGTAGESPSGPSTVDGPCFARVSGPLLTGSSFTFHQAAGRTRYFRLSAENAAHQLTGSAVLTITT